MWPFVSLTCGVVIGASALLFGVSVGARVYDRRGPEILAAALRN